MCGGVDLHAWSTCEDLEDFILYHNYQEKDHGQKLQQMRSQALSSDDYHLLAEASRTTGVIDEIDPYEQTSRLTEIMSRASTISPSWYTYLFDDHIPTGQIPYDRKFCQILRAGLEDAQMVLLLALLPHIRTIICGGGPHHAFSLDWKAGHKFATLRELIVTHSTQWPIGFFDPLFASATKLESFQASFSATYNTRSSGSEFSSQDPAKFPEIHAYPQFPLL